MIKPYIAKNRTEALDAIESDEHRFVQLLGSNKVSY